VKVTLNAGQIQTLGHDLLNPADHPDPDETDIEIVQALGKVQLKLDGAYLHEDGDFATYPDGADPGIYTKDFAYFVEPESPVVWEYRDNTMIGRLGQKWVQAIFEEGQWITYLKETYTSDQLGTIQAPTAMDAIAVGEAWLLQELQT
jgi:hypothetical protein